MLKRIISSQHYVYISFFLYALVLGGIFPRLADLQLQMGVTKSVLGGALIGSAVGVQISLMFAGPLLKKAYRRTKRKACSNPRKRNWKADSKSSRSV